MQIIEQLLVAESRDNRNNVVSSDTSEWQNAVTLAAKDMKNIANLHELELYNSQPFCWSGADNTLDFVIPVKRNRVTELTLNIVAVMKSEFIIAMIIIVDGDVVKINAREVQGVIQVFARLPKQSKIKPTTERLTLPETLSPSELGSGNDMRKMGIALASIGINPVASRFARFTG